MPTAEQITAAANAAPTLDAGTAVAAGVSASSVPEAVQNASVAANIGTTTTLVDGLKKQPISAQLAYWNSSNHATQSRLTSMGYEPPPDPATTHPVSFWGHVLGAASTAIGAVTNFVKPVAAPVLKAMNIPLSTELHAYRAGQLVAQDGMGGQSDQQVQSNMLGMNRIQGLTAAGAAQVGPLGAVNALMHPSTLTHMLSPSAWERDWRETQNGQTTFDPAVTNQIKKNLSPATYNVAHALASGDTEQQIISNLQGQEKLDMIDAINSPEVQSAVQQLNAAHLSPGRGIVGQQFIVQHPELGKVISGGIDATFDVLADPMQHTGAAMKAVRASRYGVTGDMAAEHLNALRALNPEEAVEPHLAAVASGEPAPAITGQAEGSIGTGNMVHAETYAVPDTTAYYAKLQNPQVQRWISSVGKIISEQGISAAERYDPRVLQMGAALRQAGVHDAESLAHFMGGEVGMKAILEGKAAMQDAGVSLLPHLTPVGLARMQAKGLLARSIDWAAEQSPKFNHDFTAEDVSSGSKMGDDALDSTKGFPTGADDLLHPDGTPLGRKSPLAALGVKGVSLAARAIKRMTTLTPDSGVMDLTSEDAPVMLKRMLSYSLPAHQVNAIVDKYMAEAELGKKFDIYKGAMNQMLVHAGIDPNSDIAAEFNRTLEESFHSGAYATNGLDDRGDGVKLGLDANDMSNTVHMPSFRDVRAAATRDRFYRHLGMPVPDTFDKMGGVGAKEGFDAIKATDNVMKYWKAALLLRPGFAFRVALSDETFGNILRNGLGPYLMARVGAKKGWMADEERKFWESGGTQEQWDKMYHGKVEGRVGAAMAALTAKIPLPLLAKVRTANDFASLTWAHAAHGLYTMHGGALTLPEYLDSAKSFYTHQWSADSVLHDSIASVAHGAGAGEPDHIGDVALGGGQVVNMSAQRAGVYSLTSQADPLFHSKWWFQLDHAAKGPLKRVVLEHMEEGKAAQAQAVYDAMKSGAHDDWLKNAARYHIIPGDPPREVLNETMRDEALKDWSAKIVESVHQALDRGSNVTAEDASSGPIHDVVQHMLANKSGPDIEALEKYPAPRKPIDAYGPEFREVPKTDKLIGEGFHKLSRIIDWISREPMTLQAYATFLKDSRKFAAAKLAIDGEEASPEAIEKWASDRAAKMAMEKVKPFIHSPEIRSQFEIIHRTAMPFLFAQDQFIKRWSRTFIDSPDAIRKMQMTMHGLEMSGFIQTDPTTGQQIFCYPGSALATSIVAGVMQKFHMGASIPVGIPWTGQVNNLAPGFSNPTTPSVGPVVSLPLKAASGIFPELQPAQQSILGPGASGNFLSQITPTTVSRLVTAATGSPNNNSEFLSSMVKAMQLMAATGHGLPEDATAAQKQAYINRLQSWTRTLFVTKAMLGFVVPSSPTADFDPKNLDSRLRQLMAELPYNDAITEFLKEHPNATPYTVFASQSTGDVPDLPSTQGAADFMNANQSFVQDFPLASGWFIPKTTGTEPFDPAVYRTQIQYGMRAEKLPPEFLNDLIKGEAASIYYQSENNYYAAYNQVTNSAQKTQMRESYDNWKSNFLAQNPTFADYLTGGGAAVKRSETLREIQQALPSAPESPQTDHIRVLMQSFQNFEQAYAATQGNFSTKNVANQASMKQNFSNWATQYITANPDVADLYNVLMVPEVGQNALSQGVIYANQ